MLLAQLLQDTKGNIIDVFSANQPAMNEYDDDTMMMMMASQQW